MRTLDYFQSQAVKSSARILFLISGPQSGKTFGAMAANYRRMELVMAWWKSLGSPKEYKPEFFLAAPTEDFLKEKTIPKFEEALPEGVTWKYRPGANKTWIDTSTGMEIRLVPFFNPNNVESFTSYGGVVDEAGQGWDGLYKAFRKRTSVRRRQLNNLYKDSKNPNLRYLAAIAGWLIFPTHPYTYNWLYNEIWKPFMEQGKQEKNVEIIHWKVIDVPYFDEEDYQKDKAEMSDEEFALVYEGRYPKPTRMIYRFRDEEFIVSKTLVPVDEDFQEVIIGLDFGSAHPCGISVIGLQSGSYYIIQEIKEKDLPVQVSDRSSLPSLEKKLRKLIEQYPQTTCIYADSSRPDLIKKLQSGRNNEVTGEWMHGLPVKPAVKFGGALESGIEEVKSLIKQRRLFCEEKCLKHIAEFRSYRRKEVNGETTDQIEKKNDDLMDAMRYAIWTHKITIKDIKKDEYFTRLTPEVTKTIVTEAKTPKHIFDKNNYDGYSTNDSWYVD